MKIQKLPSQFGPSGQTLEALDNIRFEHPFFDHPDTKVTFGSLPVGPSDQPDQPTQPTQPSLELGSKGEVKCNVSNLDHFEEVIPHIFGVAGASHLSQELANKVRDNMLPQDADYIHSLYNSLKLPPEGKLFGSYLANRLHAWLGSAGKNPIGFLPYIKKYPPDKHILGVLNNVLLQL